MSRRVVLLTASIGGGHDGPARELARRLSQRGVRAETVDLVRLAPCGAGNVLRWIFRTQLTWAPGTWGAWFDRLDRPGVRLPAPVQSLISATAPRLGELLAADDSGPAADLVVSTFPLGGHLMAAERRVGPLVPSVTYITDPAVHRLWLAEGTDGYLITWQETVGELSRLLAESPGAAGCSVHSVSPAVKPAFRFARRGGDERARRSLDLPSGPLALLSSGSWGVGQVLQSAVDLAHHTRLTPVVVCGHNERLRRAVAKVPGAVALGWVDDMAGLMRSCQVAVLNSGGLTLAEAAICGLPVVHYRPLVGQGAANASFGVRTGRAPHCRDATQLGAAIRDARARSPRPLPVRDPADVILEMLAGADGTVPVAS